ncbi:MAG: hypothetical protein N3A54_01710 [Patescibacteria group bacterium]|nr:hypothetical protein [Patescibacteria group bacterium]
MIIIDINSLIIPNILQSEDISEEKIRVLTLNLTSAIMRKFKTLYSMKLGTIIVDDDVKSWRKSIFPYYKKGRSEYRFLSPLNWKKLYNNFDKIKKELVEYFPMPYLKVENCEADDLISVVTENVVDKLKEDVLIISDDRDFFQLHCQYVFQYSPLYRKMITYERSPTEELYMKIFYGDRGDFIPNYLCEDDVFVNKKEIKKVSYGRVAYLLDNIYQIDKLLTDEERPGFYRNKKLIDFQEIPVELKKVIFENFLNVINKNGELGKTAKYLKDKNMLYLINRIGDFER